ncbi:MAG: ParB N-terminal domain-containing protein [Planctomycetes bacterium]|nr:ParB N-terminal domain-containing protein [Planctomycetota bacterium]
MMATFAAIVVMNFRTWLNNDMAVNAVAKSIDEFGWRQPIVVDECGVILAGHTRYKAALELGHTEVPVHNSRAASARSVQTCGSGPRASARLALRS